jgi:predicted transcriptional regulator YdeE/DNA-binding transcriptional ArsR family regulator
MTDHPFESKDAMKAFILETVNEISELLKTLYHPKRLEILALMMSDHKDFGALMEQTGLPKSALGNHLSSLLEKNLVEKLDRGVYRITMDGQELLSSITTCYLNAKVGEQERLERQRRKYQEMISRYTRYRFENGELLVSEANNRRKSKMEVEVKALPAFTVIGMRDRGIKPTDFIPPLFKGLEERFDEIKGKVKSNNVFGISYEIDKSTKEFSFLVGYEIGSGTEVPEGMTTYAIPEHTYAVVKCTLPDLSQAWKFASQWIKENGYKDISPPEFELYPESHEKENDPMYIYVPIEKT